MIYLNEITYDDVLETLQKNPNISKTFRYYETRSLSNFKNHKHHFFLKVENEVVGYGHLDFEGKLWLGMFVTDNFIGQGYGKIILQKLIDISEHDLYLSVDKDNISAINLYLRNGFKIYDQTEEIFYCRLKK